MGCADLPSVEGRSAHPISVLSESIASYLCYQGCVSIRNNHNKIIIMLLDADVHTF